MATFDQGKQAKAADRLVQRTTTLRLTEQGDTVTLVVEDTPGGGGRTFYANAADAGSRMEAVYEAVGQYLDDPDVQRARKERAARASQQAARQEGREQAEAQQRQTAAAPQRRE